MSDFTPEHQWMRNKPLWFTDIAKQAIGAFDAHILSPDSESGKWYIHRVYTDGKWKGKFCGQYATEIICLRNGRLFVGGDIDDVVFGYSSHSTPEARVSWVGAHHSFDYIQEKASIGMTDGGKLTSEFYPEKALDELRWHLEQEDDDNAHEIGAWQHGISLIEAGYGQHELQEHLCDTGFDSDYLNIGESISIRVIYAWAACRRLCELLGLVEWASSSAL